MTTAVLLTFIHKVKIFQPRCARHNLRFKLGGNFKEQMPKRAKNQEKGQEKIQAI